MEKHYILGINGWFEGIHDAAAVLVEFDKNTPAKILAGLEEEKVVGTKGLFDLFPQKAVKHIFEITGLKPNELSAVAIGWDYPHVYQSLTKEFDFPVKKILAQIFPDEKSLDIPVLYVNHHQAHANSAHFASNFKESLSLVVDGNGELESSSLWHYQDKFRSCIDTFSPISSLGFLFEATNTMLGFRNNESGKTMGLSGYGTPRYSARLLAYFGEQLTPSKKLEKLYQQFLVNGEKKLLMPYQEVCIKMWRYIFEFDLGIKALKTSAASFYDFPEELKDLAASVQDVLEKKLLSYIQEKVSELDIHTLTISGGVGLNCILNGKILDLATVENIFVQPAAGDSGVALGAALEYGYQNNFNCYIENFSPYIGKEYSDEEIEKFLVSNKIMFEKTVDASEKLGQFIKNEEIVAVFQGRNEWGPRALGNRTILSLPSEGKLDLINKNVKCRELGRPLAPSLISDDLNLLVTSKPKSFGRYMNVAHKATKLNEANASVIHIDHTFRPQCVFEKDNPTYYSQLSQVKAATGSSILINTSFNADTPIIYSLESAIDFMKGRIIDKIIFNNKFIVSRLENE